MLKLPLSGDPVRKPRELRPPCGIICSAEKMASAPIAHNRVFTHYGIRAAPHPQRILLETNVSDAAMRMIHIAPPGNQTNTTPLCQSDSQLKISGTAIRWVSG